MHKSTMARRVYLTAALAATPWVHAAETQDDSDVIGEIVVTGTRVADRSRLDTLAPVDMLPAETLVRSGSTELAETLSTVAPSLNFPRPAITDGTDHIRPATLRGLAPDQTLVLVNSKRRHQSALVNVNGSVGRGSAAVDLNAIPLAAIERVEVLRDGASAQYGSDAIAGVINIQLRKASSGGNASVTYGGYDTDVDTARGDRSESDGEVITGSAWAGLPLGGAGFLTLTGEYRDRDPTSRGDLDTRVSPARVTSRYGDSRIEDLTFYANAGMPVGAAWELYGWAGYQQREGESAAFFRLATDARNVPAIYPEGFLPLITTDIDDVTVGAGTRGRVGDWDMDASLVYGDNQIDYGVENSLNASFGPASQTSFDAGTMEYDQLVFNLGFVRATSFGRGTPINIALGVEARRESYGIEAGEPASYERGPVATAPLGSQGFPGFQPTNEVDEDRTAYGGYIDVESQLTERFLASVAARAEDYSDFGSAVTGKISARYDFSDAFALRGTVSTGFRAPGLQQAFFTSTATNFITGAGGVQVPTEIGTFPATSAVAQTLGARPLDAEESVNYSLGAVFRIDDFEATIDAYRIDIDDRIVLSENLNQPNVAALIAPFGAGAARFFINGVDTTTEGVDIVLRQRMEAGAGRLDLTASANFNDTEVTRLPSTDVLSSLDPPPVLFGRINTLSFEEATPDTKFSLAGDWTQPIPFGDLGVTLKGTYYGDVVEPGLAADGSQDIDLGTHWLVDLEIRGRLHNGLALALGVDNVLDEYPNETPAALNPQAAVGFSRYSAFGFNGRFYYGRLAFSW